MLVCVTLSAVNLHTYVEPVEMNDGNNRLTNGNVPRPQGNDVRLYTSNKP